MTPSLPSCVLWWMLLLSAAQRSLANEKCGFRDRCPKGLSCQMGTCVPMNCFRKELDDLNDSFDPKAYKRMLYREAGITERDLFIARHTHSDDNEFSQTPTVQSFMAAIQSHSYELMEIARVIEVCNEEAASGRLEEAEKESAEGHGIGRWVGDIFSAVTDVFDDSEEEEDHDGGDTRHRRLDDSDDTPSASPSSSISPSATPSYAPSAEPSVSMAPSVSSAPSLSPSVSVAPSEVPSEPPSMVPSSVPTNFVDPRIYLGFHMEGGLLLDGSCSLMFPTSNATGAFNGTTTRGDTALLYLRACFGAELGAGAEVSLFVMVAENREQDAIIGTSVMAEFLEAGIGAHIGVGVGQYFSGDQTIDGNNPVHYEVTIGAGLGIGIIGGSVCRTDICDFGTPPA